MEKSVYFYWQFQFHALQIPESYYVDTNFPNWKGINLIYFNLYIHKKKTWIIQSFVCIKNWFRQIQQADIENSKLILSYVYKLGIVGQYWAFNQIKYLSNVISGCSLQQYHAVFKCDVTLGCMIIVATHPLPTSLCFKPFFFFLLGCFQLLGSSSAKNKGKRKSGKG